MHDVVAFIEDVAREIGDYNPFNYFDSYIDPATGLRKYTPEQAAQRNALLDRCFEVCGQQHSNFINLSLVVYEEARDIIAYMRGKDDR